MIWIIPCLLCTITETWILGCLVLGSTWHWRCLLLILCVAALHHVGVCLVHLVCIVWGHVGLEDAVGCHLAMGVWIDVLIHRGHVSEEVCMRLGTVDTWIWYQEVLSVGCNMALATIVFLPLWLFIIPAVILFCWNMLKLLILGAILRCQSHHRSWWLRWIWGVLMLLLQQIRYDLRLLHQLGYSDRHSAQLRAQIMKTLKKGQVIEILIRACHLHPSLLIALNKVVQQWIFPLLYDFLYPNLYLLQVFIHHSRKLDQIVGQGVLENVKSNRDKFVEGWWRICLWIWRKTLLHWLMLVNDWFFYYLSYVVHGLICQEIEEW